MSPLSLSLRTKIFKFIQVSHDLLWTKSCLSCYHDISIYINMTWHELNKHKNHHLVLPPTESHTSEYSEAHLVDSTHTTHLLHHLVYIKEDLIWWRLALFYNLSRSFILAWKYSLDWQLAPLLLVIETNFSLVSFKYKPQYK